MKTYLPAAGAALGLLIMIASGFLPWTWNDVKGPGAIGYVTAGFAYGLACLAHGATAILLLVRRWGAALAVAFAGLLVVAVSVSMAPLGVMTWDGVDQYGRPTGGMERTTLGPAPYLALAATTVVLIAAVVGVCLRPGRQPGQRAASVPSSI